MAKIVTNEVTFKYGTNTVVVQAYEVNPPELTGETVGSTVFGGNVRTNVIGIFDGGEASVGFFFDPEDESHLGLIELFEASSIGDESVVAIEIAMDDTSKWVCTDAIPTSFAPETLTPGDLMKATVTFKLNAIPTIEEVSGS